MTPRQNFALAVGVVVAALTATGVLAWALLQAPERVRPQLAAPPVVAEAPPLAVPAAPADPVSNTLALAVDTPALAVPADDPLLIPPAVRALSPTETPPPTAKYVTNAVPAPAPKPGYARLVIVLDDMGVSVEYSERALRLPGPLTLSFLPYGHGTKSQAARAKTLGHEVMVHLPMEPKPRPDGTTANPGPDALYVATPNGELPALVKKNLAPLAALAVGVNNHMGSRFTADRDGMRTVLETLEAEGFFFLDSLTSAESVAKDAAHGLAVPVLTRDVFLDHLIDTDLIRQALAKAAKRAHKNGVAIAIGHPHARTLEVLADWLPTLEAQKIQLVPISAIVTTPPVEDPHDRPEPNAYDETGF